jgi:demethylmenaquinone methyltransferase/2-methoxy-6-polyprenyl-1,4-benzoquinol methylase
MSGANAPRDRSVQVMFDRIAERYDFLNAIISFRLDRRWRHQVIQAALADGSCILDIGTGTGDLIYEAAQNLHGSGRLVGLDFAPAMLRLARAKKKAMGSSPEFVLGSAMVAPFKHNVFDSAMTAFVLRNVSDLSLLFAEANRVLRPGGRFVSLDMFPPRAKWFSPIYGFYFHRCMPRLAAWLAHDRQAYLYLSESVRRFHSPEHIAELIRQAGFEEVTIRRFLWGAVCMHSARKSSVDGT